MHKLAFFLIYVLNLLLNFLATVYFKQGSRKQVTDFKTLPRAGHIAK